MEMMIVCHIGRCHTLKGNRKNQYAVDLVHPYRWVLLRMGRKYSRSRIKEWQRNIGCIGRMRELDDSVVEIERDVHQ